MLRMYTTAPNVVKPLKYACFQGLAASAARGWAIVLYILGVEATMYCVDCKHWRLVTKYERKRIDGKTVLHGACERARGYAFEPDDRKSKAFALACYEDSACDLMCDEDFSCVQFERREGYVQPHLGWVNEDALTEAKARGLIK